MTAADVIARAGEIGVALWVGDVGELRYRGKSKAAVAEILGELEMRWPAIVAVLRERADVPTASGAVTAAARLLREGRWAPEAAPCVFHIGSAGVDCIRCGGAWLDHFRTWGLAR